MRAIGALLIGFAAILCFAALFFVGILAVAGTVLVDLLEFLG